MSKQFFVTGISTGIGKTVASAIIVKALNAKYWKPVQAGDLDDTDTMKVQKWTDCNVYPERYKLTSPMSPHAAAKIDGIKIELGDFELPKTNGNLIVEGAGGLMVPINHTGDMIIDLIKHLNLEVILVSQNYLGSINHTLLSIEALKNNGITIYGILFNGPENKETEEFILNQTSCISLGRLETKDELNKTTIAEMAKNISI